MITKKMRPEQSFSASHPFDNFWVLVPARGGSKGIPRKNLRFLAGKPLISYVLDELLTILDQDHLIVSTDDDEIKNFCSPYALIHHRPDFLATDQSTLDDVSIHVSHWLLEQGANANDILLTVQPTSPFLKAQSIIECVRKIREGAASVLSVVDARHLRWTIDGAGMPIPLYEKRLNRQWLPPILAETGGVIGARIGGIIAAQTRVQEPVALVEVDRLEGLDIDSYADWAVAEYYVRRKRVVIRSDASPQLGMGHVYRSLALCHELAEHELHIVTRNDGEYDLGAKFLEIQPYPLTRISDEDQFVDFLSSSRTDIVILDILDTEEDYVQRIRAYTDVVVSLEDLGSGARLADIVINDLYTDLYPQHNHWYGVEFAILGPQFETTQPVNEIGESVEHILVAFGGTDPRNLTLKAVQALAEIDYSGRVTVVLGPGYRHGTIDLAAYGLRGSLLQSVGNMATIMRSAGMAITSAGRTVTELMTLGIPTIVMCQNDREIRHTHASSPYGVINLGLGDHIDVSTLSRHIAMLLVDYGLRKDMRARALMAVRNRSNRAIAQKILETAYSESTTRYQKGNRG